MNPRAGRSGALVLLLLLTAALTALALRRHATPPVDDPCAGPLAWHLGFVDHRHDLSYDAFRQAVEEAIWTWEQASGTPLFRHDPDGGTVVELVYDERQDTYERQRELADRVDGLQDDIEWQDSRVRTLQDRMRSAEAAHRERPTAETAARYQAAAEQYNRAVDAFNAVARRHNDAVRDLAAAGSADVAVGSMRRETRTRNGRPTEVRRTVTIAYAGRHAELVLILTHELGHALGIGHVDAEGAVMAERYRHGEIEYPVRLHDADLRALEQRCVDSDDGPSWWP